MNFGMGLGGLAGAGFPPVNTPSSACANCGELCDHHNGMVPMDQMSAKLCAVCKSYTYMVCSKKCLKEDRKRHQKDCREKMRSSANYEEFKKKDQKLRDLRDMREFTTGSDLPNAQQINSMFDSESVKEMLRNDEADVNRIREEENTKALKLRNRQLHHATEMFKKRHNLEDVGPPPHVTACRYCRKAAKVNAKTFHTDMARCSRCLLVRYCSVECQKKDRKNHKKECRDGKFQ